MFLERQPYRQVDLALSTGFSHRAFIVLRACAQSNACIALPPSEKVRHVKVKQGEGKKMKAQSPSAVRASISFPPDVYETLEVIAKEKRVSLAWVVRDAAEQYIGEKWPLFSRKTGEQQ